MCLQKYIEECIVPCYKNFDRAHGVDHVRAVINRSLFYAGRYGADARMAYVIAAGGHIAEVTSYGVAYRWAWVVSMAGLLLFVFVVRKHYEKNRLLTT